MIRAALVKESVLVRFYSNPGIRMKKTGNDNEIGGKTGVFV